MFFQRVSLALHKNDGNVPFPEMTVNLELSTPDFPDGLVVPAWRLRLFSGIPSVSDHYLPKRPRNPMGDRQNDALRVDFQLAEVAVPRQLFAAILERIGRLRLAGASE